VQIETEFEQDEAPLSYYLEVAKRRLPFMAAVAAVIFAIGAIVAIALPPLYESTATILVESQQIPSDLVKSTITGYAEERIEVLRQQVMTRDNLLDIVKKYHLFAKKGEQSSPTDLVDKLRGRVTVQQVNTTLSGGGRSKNKSAIAFSISYEDESPQTAQQVTQDLVNLFLNKNVTTRTQRAEDTTIFLSDQAKDFDKQVTETEKKIAAYKAQYRDSLPENLALNRSSLEEAQNALTAAQNTERSLRQQNTYLRLGSQSLASSGTGSGDSSDLVTLKAKLSSLQGVYGPAHPDVVALKKRIAAIEAERAAPAQKATQPTDDEIKSLAATGNPDAIRLAAQLASNTAQLEDLKNTEAQLNDRIADLKRRVERTPEVEQGLLQMQRDYENALSKYREIKSKELEAQVAQNLEESQNAERFTLLERPLAPDHPTKPNRGKILALGVVLAFGGGIGFGTLAESLDSGIRGRRTLERVLGTPLLGTVPMIWTDEEALARRKRRRFLFMVLVAGAIVALLAIHFLYMPLDVVWGKLVQRFGG
jgi:polysaccharide chain length determinant protein (PEP-CTERM system associated)